MIYQILALVLLFSTSQPNGNPTLNAGNYEQMKSDAIIFPSQSQLLYAETICDYNTGDLYLQNMHIYGDGLILIAVGSQVGSNSELHCYSITDERLEEVSDSIVNLGIFDAETDIVPLLDDPGREIKTYFISMRIGDSYRSALFNSVHKEQPDWIDLVAYLKELLEEYKLDEFEIGIEEYAKLLDEEAEVYGRNSWMEDHLIDIYLSEGGFF